MSYTAINQAYMFNTVANDDYQVAVTDYNVIFYIRVFSGI